MRWPLSVLHIEESEPGPLASSPDDSTDMKPLVQMGQNVPNQGDDKKRNSALCRKLVKEII